MHPSPSAPERAASRPFEPLLALGLPALLFLSAIGRAGLWDPYELNIADLGRRAAIHVFGAQNLALAGAENRIPTLGDLGRNELPITSMALSFRLFGLSEWAGRLPLALWGLGGIVALWAWLRRMVSPRAATYGTLLLATTPLYFVHARTMLGDIVTMASCLMAFAGLSVSLLDPEPRGASDLRWLGLGLVGLVGGFLSRGSLIGVAVPALAVGLTWGLSVLGSAAGGRPEVTPVRGAGVAALLVAGLMGGYLALSGASHATPLNYSPWLGSAIVLGQKFPTFDAVALQLGHTLFPWSAFLPLAIGRLLAPPPGIAGPSLVREQRLRMLLIVGAGLSYAALGWVAPRTGMQPFAGVGLVAAMGALVLLDFERGAHASRALAVASSLLAVLFYTDFSRMPEKAMSVFGVTTASFPESFREPGGHLLLGATALFLVLLLLSLVDGHEPYPDQVSKPAWARLTAAEETWAILNELNEVWAGNLSFLAVMFEAMLAGIGALIFVSDRLQWRLTFTGTLSAGLKTALVNAWWAVPVALGGGLFVLLTLRHLFRLLLGRSRGERAWVAAAAGVLAGLVLSLGYYPALASQLSPKEVFESYRKLHAGDEPLGLLGVAGRSASYYSRGDIQAFSEPGLAFSWLTEGSSRRWLAVRSEELAKLNSLYRSPTREGQSTTPDHNLPVLDARSSQIVLVSNLLGAGEENQNPFGRLASLAAPHPLHPLSANLNDELMALGWEVFDEADTHLADVVVPGKTYRLHLYFKVLATPSSSWKGFIHIDGFGRRFNGDHELFDGKYPMSLWQPGDIITDRFEFKLEPNFTPGNYTLFYGFFVGDRRLQVKSGKNHENRIDGGPFPIR